MPPTECPRELRRVIYVPRPEQIIVKSIRSMSVMWMQTINPDLDLHIFYNDRMEHNNQEQDIAVIIILKVKHTFCVLSFF